VLVIGSGGSGKSTVARRIGDALGRPVIHLDAHYWRAGWTPMEPDAWVARVNALARGEAWVMDGNYGGTLDARLAACDTVVFLDMPRVLCLWRVIRRRVAHHGRTRPDLAPGCPEQVPWEFLRWIWTYPRRRRPGILRRLEGLPREKHVIVLRSRREVGRFLAELEPPAPPNDSDRRQATRRTAAARRLEPR
jgi:adenylate kinase family enzyme